MWQNTYFRPRKIQCYSDSPVYYKAEQHTFNIYTYTLIFLSILNKPGIDTNFSLLIFIFYKVSNDCMHKCQFMMDCTELGSPIHHLHHHHHHHWEHHYHCLAPHCHSDSYRKKPKKINTSFIVLLCVIWVGISKDNLCWASCSEEKFEGVFWKKEISKGIFKGVPRGGSLEEHFSEGGHWEDSQRGDFCGRFQKKDSRELLGAYLRGIS